MDHHASLTMAARSAPIGMNATLAHLWRLLVRVTVAGLCLVSLSAADSRSVASAPAAISTDSSAFLASLTKQGQPPRYPSALDGKSET